jgi:hypothetical protein
MEPMQARVACGKVDPSDYETQKRKDLASALTENEVQKFVDGKDDRQTSKLSLKIKQVVGRVFNTGDLIWRGETLCIGGRKLAEIKPDAEWPGMWRIIVPGTPATPDSSITDMTNRSRAVDAAMAVGLAILNRKRCHKTPSEALPVGQNGRGRP